jgi:hypothetical protein
MGFNPSEKRDATGKWTKGGPTKGKKKKRKFKLIGGVKRKVTGKGKRGVGLGLHGKGRKITKRGYTGKGEFGYGRGKHGVAGKKSTSKKKGK